MSKTVPSMPAIAHKSETSTATKLEMDWPILEGGGGWASAGRPFSFELKTLGEKVGNCQSLPSDFILLGTSYSIYWWVQSLKDIQVGVNVIWSHRCSILICHPIDCCNRGYVVLGLSNSSYILISYLLKIFITYVCVSACVSSLIDYVIVIIIIFNVHSWF